MHRLMLLAGTAGDIDWSKAIKEVASEQFLTSIEQVSRIVDVLRTGARSQASIRLSHLCRALERDLASAKVLGRAVQDVVAQSDVTLLLTESGVLVHKGFTSELFRRLGRRFVPELDDPSDLRTSLRAIFCKDDDHRWINAIPDEIWWRLLAALGIGEEQRLPVSREWAASLRILSHHIASLGLQPEITHRLPELDDADSPFLMLSDQVSCYTKALERNDETEENRRHCLQKALEVNSTCRAQVERLREEKNLYGTSLRLTALSFRLLQLINRLESLLQLTVVEGEALRAQLITLFREVVKAENTRNHIRPHIRDSGDLLAFQVVEHAAKKGSKYITSGRQDYWKFFVASLGGGFIVATFALIKVLLKQVDVPLGIEAILYGVNYSICFIVIYLTGTALATKQPAMTANTLAQSLEGEENGLHLERLGNLIVRVWRSQFISFAGNLLMALPVAYLFSLAFHHFTGLPIVDDAASQKILAGINPWRSGALVYAAVAGVFLFASGLIAGWVDNRNLYRHYPDRIAKHPLLVRLLGADRAARMGAFLDRNLGILAGNIVLGFCLGSTATVGEILGLPLDIRHIAFSSAEYGISLEVLGNVASQPVVLNAGLGVMLIGLVNFLVSFGLSLTMALESRRMRFGETRRLLGHLARRVMRHPLEWFFPPK